MSMDLNYSEFHKLRTMAFKAHGRKCAKCGKHQGQAVGGFVVHHRHYRTFGKEQPEDVVVLCKTCHVDLHQRANAKQLTAADAPLVDPLWKDMLK